MKRLELLDYCRFFAALSVLIYHYTFSGINVGKVNSFQFEEVISSFTKYGYLGVELFFMISGFVIFFSATNRNATSFIVNRAVRLYPAYWFAVIFTSIVTIAFGGEQLQVYIFQVLLNLTMLQSYLGIMHVDGVYWTLVYEIEFYFAVYLLILFGFKKYLVQVFVSWPFVMLLSLIFGLDNFILLGGYFSYFAAGAIFAILSEKVSTVRVFSLLITYYLCVNYTITNIQITSIKNNLEYSNQVGWLMVTLFFVIFLYQISPHGRTLKLPCSRLAGNLTYPIYLIHMHVGYIVLNRFANNDNKYLVISAVFVLVVLIAVFINRVLEEKFHFLWKLIFERTIGGISRKFELGGNGLISNKK